MNLWYKFLVKFFPFESRREYEQSKKIHIIELKKYRKHWQYIFGQILFFIPLIILFFYISNWYYRMMLFLVIIGEMFIRDTITEHFCLKRYREKNTE